MRDKVTRQCPQTKTFEEKGEPKRIRTEASLLTSLTPYRWAKAAHDISSARSSPQSPKRPSATAQNIMLKRWGPGQCQLSRLCTSLSTVLTAVWSKVKKVLMTVFTSAGVEAPLPAEGGQGFYSPFRPPFTVRSV